MKRTLLTILPIAAALLLATSCSKDSDNDNGTDDVHIVSTANTGTDDVHIVSTDESDAIPFSIKVVTSNDGLSKIGYVDADGKVTPSFTTGDVTAKLAMTISEGTTELGTLTLQDADGNFSGNLTTEPSADGVTLTATISTTGDATSSTESITELMEKCAHTYTGTFAYKTDTKVMLTDDKAYIEILMSPLQHNIDVTISGDKQPYAMSNDGKVWIAVDGGTKFTTNFTNEKTATAGKITTIKREGFVDLGIESGILWADKNIGATNVYDYGNYYAWGETVPYYADGHSTDSPCKDWRTVGERTFNGYNWTNYAGFDGDVNGSGFTKYKDASTSTLSTDDDIAHQTYQKDKVSMPTTDEFAALKSSCYWVWTADYSGNKGYIVYKVKKAEHAGKVKYARSGDNYASSYTTDDTHIFLPAAGYRNESYLRDAGSHGNYWSASLNTGGPSYAYCLNFGDGSVYAQSVGGRYYGQSVRAVRRK